MRTLRTASSVLGDPPQRVHVISGSFGAGHDSAAREIAERLVAAGHIVTHHDVVDFFPVRLGRCVRAAYLWQIRTRPGSWGTLLGVLRHETRSFRAATNALRLAKRRLLSQVRGADLVISTHPFASQALGHARACGALTVPALTYLTDASVHPLWVHPAVDLHLAWNATGAAQARSFGAHVRVIDPLTPLSGHASVPTLEELAGLRAELGMLTDRPIALVVGGSLGIGELAETASDLLATGLVQPVVLCGTNTRLLERVNALPGAIGLGWRDDLPRLLALASVVVQNAGGFMSLEAMAAGVPVISYRCLPGHGETNAAALAASGLVPWAADSPALAGQLTWALTSRRRGAPLELRPSLLDVLAGVRNREPVAA